MVVWFDAFVQNVDRTARNPNLLMWHRRLHFIDHGAALYFHHNWESAKAESSFSASRQHVLLPWASAIREAAKEAHRRITPEVLGGILEMVPDEWLESEARNATARRGDYLAYLTKRLVAAASFEEEAVLAYEQRLV